jgi:hypothetical protein
MKLLFIPLVFVSISISAQSTEKKIPFLKKDTLKMKIADLNTSKKNQQKDLYKILVLKPKNPDIYACLKDKRIDNTDYKILNSTPPEKVKLLSKKK